MPIKVEMRVPTKPLGSAIQIKRGISWGEDQECESTHPCATPVLRIPNVQENLVLDNLLYLKGIRSEQIKRFGATKGWTLLVGSNGNPERVGNPAYLDVDRGFVFASFLMAVAPIEPDQLLPKFLYYFIRTEFVQQAITESVLGTTGLKNLRQEVLANLPLPQFQLAEQRRIIEALDAVDAAIRQTDVVIAKLRLMKAGLLHDLLTRGLDEQGKLRDPQHHPEQFRDSPVGRIPKGWDVSELARVVDPNRPIVYGILMPGYGYRGGVPVIKVKDIIDGEVNTQDLLLTDPKIDLAYRRSRVKPGDLLFTIRGTVGRMALVPVELDNSNITQDTARIAVAGADARFVRAALEMPGAVRFIELHTGGVAVQGINLGDLRCLPVPVPPLPEQKQIADRLDAFDLRIRSEESYLDKLKLQKRGLMHDLLTGQVPV